MVEVFHQTTPMHDYTWFYAYPYVRAKPPNSTLELGIHVLPTLVQGSIPLSQVQIKPNQHSINGQSIKSIKIKNG